MTYSPRAIQEIQRRWRELQRGYRDCLTLASSVGFTEVYEDVKNLRIRCPLHESGECARCAERLEAGAIDMYQAVRDLGLVTD